MKRTCTPLRRPATGPAGFVKCMLSDCMQNVKEKAWQEYFVATK